MKKILILFLSLFSFSSWGQSTLILPTSTNQDTPIHVLKTANIAMGFSHTNGTVSMGTYITNGGGYLQTHTSHPLLFTTANGAEKMRLSYSSTPSLDGNLGIATINPQEKLHVVGNIRTSSLAGTGLKLVMADANGTLKPSNPVAFSSNLGVNFSMANGTLYTLPFGVESYDLGSNYDNTNYIFIAPINGIYNFNTTIIWSSLTATSGNMLLQLYGPSGVFAQSTMPIYDTNKFTTNTVSSDIKLDAGQIVKVFVYQNSGITLNLAGNLNPYTAIFSGHLVSPL